MKYLIIGSEGFIGNHCVNYFHNTGKDIIGLDLYEQPSRKYNYIKISRLSPNFDDVFKNNNISVVINCAGSANVLYSMTHPFIDFEANCLDAIRVLDMIRIYSPESKYIHISSAAVYGNPSKIPIMEFDNVKPLSVYGWHKEISEILCQEYSTIYNLKIAVLRPFSVYGSGLKKQLFFDLYNKCKNKQHIELYGTGQESRDYIHVFDLVKVIEAVINNSDFTGKYYNVASGRETTIKKAVDIFINLLPWNISYEFNGEIKSGDPLNWQADITSIKKLGFIPQIELKEGLKEMINWLTNNF